MVGRASGTTAAPATFELESFSWSGPDRLELAGRFAGLADAPAAPPVLIVHGAKGSHRLPAVEEGMRAPPDGAGRWSAEFAWLQPPIPFDGAELELGGDLVVGLPPPGARHSRFRHRIFEVRRTGAPASADTDGAPPAADQAREEISPGSGVERLHLEGELLTAQQEVRELRADLQRAREELGRARADLEAERDRHSGDAARFRESLEHVRESASQAVAVEQAAAEQLLHDLRRARDDQTATAERLRGELEAAVADQARARSEAAAELDSLREQVAALRPAVEEAEAVRAELERLRDSEARLERARGAADGARAEAEQLLARLTTIHAELGDGT